jgi:hypothetical protein
LIVWRRISNGGRNYEKGPQHTGTGRPFSIPADGKGF